MKVTGADRLPSEPSLIISNHAQMNGPIAAELYFPGRRYAWCIGHMMHLREVPGYAYQDFWSHKPKAIRWFYRLLSYAIAPLCVSVLKHAHCIGVYKDNRLLSTMRESLKRMKAGDNIVIFPEEDIPHNDIVWEFQEGFVNLASLYVRQTRQPVEFVPMYIAPALRKAFIGEPTRYSSEAESMGEKQRVKEYLMSEITNIAVSLPRHHVTPYSNMPKKNYPYNKT